MTSPNITFDLTPRQIADEIIALIQRPEDCYEESPIGLQLIPAIAPLKDHEIDGIAFSLKQRFGKDFTSARNQRWWASIRQSRESTRQESRRESPYLLTNNGGYIANLANAKTMLSSLPIQFNAFSMQSFLTTRAPWGAQGDWTDADDCNAAEWCQRQGLNIDDRTAAKAAESIARDRKPYYHPITEYLSSHEWDGVERCDRWLIACLGVADSPFVREISTKWLIAAVKRAFEPGCQSDYVLVLEGLQGRRKSSALRVLCGSDWFSDDLADIGTKDSAMQLQGNWIVEIGELDAFRRAEVSTINAWLTRRVDEFRPPYGRRIETFPRQNVFAGTTNKDDWGKDDTGLRRFWPVRVGEINIEKLAEHRDQIWAEAVHRYRAGETTYLDRDSESAARDEQSMRQDTDAWEDSVLEWVESPSGSNINSRSRRVILPEILQHCLGIPQKDWNPYQRQRVGGILRRAGYVAKRSGRSEAHDDGRRPEVWEPMNR